ncbi:fructosamine kinase family protein [Holzapfeliella sp. He02]|uniref:Fructosamine kinase family protein n=1 Tax=Holzapfeliella saturejae TaxID=3082953 RepID=A0ABU8SEG8_9LACO
MSQSIHNIVKNLNLPEPVEKYSAVTGGDINQAFHVYTHSYSFFLLVQQDATRQFFSHEVAGLKALGKFAKTPQVLDFGDNSQDAYLLLEYIDHLPHGNQYELGQALAKVHQSTSPNQQFGFDSNFELGNFTGDNQWQDNWYDFFVNQRFEPLRKLIIHNHNGSVELEHLYQNMLQQFQHDLANHQSIPSLLHGDLWGGNIMFDLDQHPVFIDPAVYYGDREFDIAITQVFGGFDQNFIQGYQDTYPLDDGYQDRLVYYKLYYMMFHLSEFGSIYQPSVYRLLQQFI